MDITTTLEIIKMLDERTAYYFRTSSDYNDDMMHGKYLAYREFSEHLQEYVEAQLNAAEIQTGE